MFKAKELDVGQLIAATPAEYWNEAREIRSAMNLYRSGNELKQLQEIAVIFSLGSVYGEEMAISRISFLEKRVNDLNDINQRMTAALRDAVRQDQSTQDVKQED